MKELRDKQKFKNILYSLPILALVVALALLLARGAGSIMLKERESARTLEALREKNADLRVREEELKGEVARLGTEEGILEEIRSKFNVARPGEHLAIVVNERVVATTSEPSALRRGWEWLTQLWGD